MLYSVEIGKNIVAIRHARGISQRKLAIKSGMSISRLRDVEHGRANCCLNKLVALADALDVHPLLLLLLSLSPEEIQDVIQQNDQINLILSQAPASPPPVAL